MEDLKVNRFVINYKNPVFMPVTYCLFLSYNHPVFQLCFNKSCNFTSVKT